MKLHTSEASIEDSSKVLHISLVAGTMLFPQACSLKPATQPIVGYGFDEFIP